MEKHIAYANALMRVRYPKGTHPRSVRKRKEPRGTTSISVGGRFVRGRLALVEEVPRAMGNPEDIQYRVAVICGQETVVAYESASVYGQARLCRLQVCRIGDEVAVTLDSDQRLETIRPVGLKKDELIRRQNEVFPDLLRLIKSSTIGHHELEDEAKGSPELSRKCLWEDEEFVSCIKIYGGSNPCTCPNCFLP